jgi:hypothetical protein
MSRCMKIYVFVSDKDPDILGFTSDETGANLPRALGPWREESESGVAVVERGDNPIAQVVERDGFFISTGWSDC